MIIPTVFIKSCVFCFVFGLKEGKNENYEQKHQGRSVMRIQSRLGLTTTLCAVVRPNGRWSETTSHRSIFTAKKTEKASFFIKLSTIILTKILF